MKINRLVVVFDAPDLDAESSFWAGILGGSVHRDPAWHSVVVDGEWVMGVQQLTGDAATPTEGGATRSRRTPSSRSGGGCPCA